MKKSRILVVDDEQSIIDSYHRILDLRQDDLQDEFHRSAANVLFGEETDSIDGDLQLEDDPYELVDAYNGADAVKVFRESQEEGNPISLVFLDIRMPPGIDGKETAKQIRAMDDLVEIVIMTAYSDYKFSEIIEDVGSAERLLYFNKPFSTEQIEQLALSLTNRWQAEQELLRQKGKAPVEKLPETVPAPSDIDQWISFIDSKDKQWKSYADRIYEKRLDPNHPEFLQYNQLRFYIQRYALNSLKQVEKSSAERQAEFLKLMVPFNSTDDFNQMVSHFFFIRNLDQPDENGLTFFKDSFVQECFILSDLLKIRKTIEVIEWMMKRIEEGKSFPSAITSDEEKVTILRNCRRVMKMTFIQCIRPEYQSLIYKKINPDFITIKSIAQRKKEELEYSWEGVLKGERYRRIFLHLIFRTFIQTRSKGKSLDIEYDLIQFELLKREFFTAWLLKLGDNPVKEALIQKICQEKKLLLKQMMDEDVLALLNNQEFDDLIAEVNTRLPEEQRAAVEPLSDKQGTLKKIKDNLLEVKEAINREAFLTASVEKMEGVLKELSGISGVSSKVSLSDICGDSSNSKEAGTGREQTETEAILSDFIMAGPIKFLLILPAKYQVLYQPLLTQACKKAGLVNWEITNDERLDYSQLSKAKVIILFRSGEIDFEEKTGINISELIGVDVYNYQIDPDRLIKQYLSVVDSNADITDLSNIKAQIDLEEIDQHSGGQVADPYEIYEQNWLKKNSSLKLTQLKQRISSGLMEMISLTQWIVMEGLVAAGHLQSLTKTLASLDKILVVFSGVDNPLSLLINAKGVPKNWEIWGDRGLQRLIQRQPEVRDCGIDKLFAETLLEKYEMAIVVDLANASAKRFPVHIGIKELISTGKKSLRHQTLSIDLLHVVKYPRFLERVNHILKKHDLITTEISLSSIPVLSLAEQTRQLQELEASVNSVKSHKQQFRWTNQEVLEQDLISRVGLRLQLFQESYRSRQPKT